MAKRYFATSFGDWQLSCHFQGYRATLGISCSFLDCCLPACIIPLASLVGLEPSLWLSGCGDSSTDWQVVHGTKLEWRGPPGVVPETAFTLAVQGSRWPGQGHLEAWAGGCLWGKEVGVQGGAVVRMQWYAEPLKVCTSLPNSMLSSLAWIVWNQLWWECSHHENQQMLQITFFVSWQAGCETFTSTSLNERLCRLPSHSAPRAPCRRPQHLTCACLRYSSSDLVWGARMREEEVLRKGVKEIWLGIISWPWLASCRSSALEVFF